MVVGFLIFTLLITRYREPDSAAPSPHGQWPPVAIVIAAWNEQEATVATLERIANLAYRGPIEVVLADNNSTEHTAELADAAATRPALHYRRVFEVGQAGAPLATDDLGIRRMERLGFGDCHAVAYVWAPGATAAPRPYSPSVLAVLAVIIPLGLAGGVSPVMLSEQAVLLAGPDGGRAGVRYAAGVVLTAFVIVVAIVLFGRAISLPTEPHLDASLDLVLGLVLVILAVLVLVWGRCRAFPGRKGRDDRRRASGSSQTRAAFPFGVFSMATNVTTLALIAAAAKEISRADAEIAAVGVLVLVLVGLVTTPAWVPLGLTRVAPGPSQRALAGLREQIARRGRVVTVGMLSAAALFFIGRGLIRVLG